MPRPSSPVRALRSPRVVTICQERLPGESDAQRLDFMLERMTFASPRRPDLVCLPECFLSEPETPDGTGVALKKLGAWAKEHRAYVIAAIYTLEGGKKFNSAVLVDRDGKPVGRYDKIHPTEGELDKGIAPGACEPTVFETDFGRIGCQICFDVNWPEGWAQLKSSGAEIIFWPSAYPASRRLHAFAWQYQVYVASATRSGPSQIVDISGDVLGKSGARSQWAEAVVHLDKRLFEIDYHIPKARAIEAKYGPRIELKWFHEEDWFTLASLDPELSVDDLIEEFELLPLSRYLPRAEAAQRAARAGQGVGKVG